MPSLHQSISGDLRGVWQPWVSDEANAAKVATLVAAMPPSARAAVDALQHEPWPILEDYLTRVTDALARRATIADQAGAQTRLKLAAQDTARLTDARYRGGVASFLESLDAQRSLYGARRSLASTRLVRARNLVDLYRAVGGDPTLS